MTRVRVESARYRPDTLPPALYADLVAVLGEAPPPTCFHGHGRDRYGVYPSDGRRYCDDCQTERVARIQARVLGGVA